MLKALELVGFKSFADKTRFEFPPGITVIVGPNGSGKSNVVDAIKWVLGEQSVKSLRGKEMADVIFNGSGTRKPANAAEITLTLDNSSKLLPIDSPEVHITRRIYRSGEGEYLINRQPCRLRDIRDLLRGTGLGTNSYCVIEQGKVDVMLQASPRERRVIFEEAAGISRFKAKRLEALRRLERVEQNLLRLSDIVEEVQSRLRSLRIQAGKARRYKEYSDRLLQLRLALARFDWFDLGGKLADIEKQCQQYQLARRQAQQQLGQIEAQAEKFDRQLQELDKLIHESETHQSQLRQQVAQLETTLTYRREEIRHLEIDTARLRTQWLRSDLRSAGIKQQLDAAQKQLQHAEQRHKQLSEQLTEKQQQLAALASQAELTSARYEQAYSALVEQLRKAAACEKDIESLKQQAAHLRHQQQQAEVRLRQLASQYEQSAALVAQLQEQETQLRTRREQLLQSLGNIRQQKEQIEQQVDKLESQLAEFEKQISALQERANVLEELERRKEGLSPATRQLLAQSQRGEGPARFIFGLVADVLQAPFESAPLIDLALGPQAHYLVARRDRQLLSMIKYLTQSGGTVGFVWLDDHPDPDGPPVDLSAEAGVLARADRIVSCQQPYQPLVYRLLSRTWIVKDLETALALGEKHPRLQFVTLAGQLVTNGTLLVGSLQGSLGLISRRSELVALRRRSEQLTAEIATLKQQIAEHRTQLAAKEKQSQELAALLEQANSRLQQLQAQLSLTRQQTQQHQQQLTSARQEQQQLTQQLQQVEAAIHEGRQRLAELQQQIAQLQSQVDQADHERQQYSALREQLQTQITEVKVELAKCEQRRQAARLQLQQLAEAEKERIDSSTQLRSQLEVELKRLRDAQLATLSLESQLAWLYLKKQAAAEQLRQLESRKLEAIAHKSRLQREQQQLWQEIRRLENLTHEEQLAAEKLRVQRDTLVQRLREDYDVDLEKLLENTSPTEHPSPGENTNKEGDAGQQQADNLPQDRQLLQQEIDELKRKLHNLGNVNLTALEELEQLEKRYEGLESQYRDLIQAKNALVQIIHRIDSESRRLFNETLEVIRGHFAVLFRNLFGGGHADILLEEAEDENEAGVEIVARPPGKEPRSISLLSGGEKTLTCVALLLALFRSKPSPFCVLDEVDAALDEANIDRFVQVLKQFLDNTQFIMITHSKKTMACANTLYGVTMQESGVSKLVSVRFEDLSDQGEFIIREHKETSSDQATDQTQAA